MPSQKSKILIVDDEVEILKVLKKSLEEDYEIVTVARAKEALDLLDDSFAVVLSDQRMPEMTGSELLRQMRDKHPDVVRIIMSGYSDMTALINSVNYGEIFRYINKPWDLQVLVETIELAVARHNLLVAQRRLADENRRLNEQNKNIAKQMDDLTTELQVTKSELTRLRSNKP